MDIRSSLSMSPLKPLLLLSQQPVPSMPLPPEAIYSSKEELYTAIQVFVAYYHYAFSISQSTKVHRGARTRIVTAVIAMASNHLQTTHNIAYRHVNGELLPKDRLPVLSCSYIICKHKLEALL